MAITPTSLTVHIDPDALQEQVRAAIQETKSVWARDLLQMAMTLNPGLKDELLKEWTPAADDEPADV